MAWKDAYLRRAKEIIGDRTPAEAAYDADVLHWLRLGLDIHTAIIRANAMHPEEALTVDDENVGDVAAHYEYLLEHEKIAAMIAASGSKKASSLPRGTEVKAMSDSDLAILLRIESGGLDKAALLADCETLDKIEKGTVEPALKRLKKDGFIFGEMRGGKTYYALTAKGKVACSRIRKNS
nr:PadR family transcriptional regulator [Candidatus Sigynarchaeum springense]